MRFHVILASSSQPESTVADIAFVRLLARVDEHMVGEPLPAVEPLLAHFALVGPFARMVAHVLLHNAALLKLLPALRTLGLFRRMGRSHVRLHFARRIECIGADVTLEAAHATVPVLVPRQVGL